MARAIALRIAQDRPEVAELARIVIVLGCPLALMLAGRALPLF